MQWKHMFRATQRGGWEDPEWAFVGSHSCRVGWWKAEETDLEQSGEGKQLEDASISQRVLAGGIWPLGSSPGGLGHGGRAVGRGAQTGTLTWQPSCWYGASK